MNYLADGQRRVMKPGTGCRYNGWLRVIAERIDADTPYVILEIDGKEYPMTDTLAQDLVAQINRALKILPSSK